MVTGQAIRMAREELPLGRDPGSVRRRIEAIEKVLERAFILPGINRPVGLDAIAGLVPVAGDTLAALVGLYLVWEARNIGMSRWQLTRMVVTVGIDWLLGLVPLVGDVFDFFYRSNSINLKRIRRHLDRHHPGAGIIEG
jgi:hypothetical protein